MLFREDDVVNTSADVEAIFEFVGFRKNNLYEGYRPAHLICDNYLSTGVHSYYNLSEEMDMDKDLSHSYYYFVDFL